MVTRLLPPALLAPPGGFEVLGAAHAAHGALRSESSASAAEEYAGSRLALVARTRRSTSEPGAITRLIPPSPRALSWLEPATSTERQLRSIARQPRRSIAIPLAPSVIAPLSNWLQRLRALASRSPSTSTRIRPSKGAGAIRCSTGGGRAAAVAISTPSRTPQIPGTRCRSRLLRHAASQSSDGPLPTDYALDPLSAGGFGWKRRFLTPVRPRSLRKPSPPKSRSSAFLIAVLVKLV